MPQDQTSQQEDNIQNLNFEEAYSKLGEIVESLENGGLTLAESTHCLLYTSPSPRDLSTSRMPASA